MMGVRGFVGALRIFMVNFCKKKSQRGHVQRSAHLRERSTEKTVAEMRVK